MRIGALVLLSNGKAMQSYMWKHLRPLGDLQGVVDSLDEYQCDEIAIVRPVRGSDGMHEFRRDVEVLSKIHTMTPISFGGGIRDCEHLKILNDLPIERLVFTSAVIESNNQLLESAITRFGRQALQCLLPIMVYGNRLMFYNPGKDSVVEFTGKMLETIRNFINEAVLFDCQHEGLVDSFSWEIVESMVLPIEKIIITGGVGFETIREAKKASIAAVYIDNKVLHKECAIEGYKDVE